MTKDLITKNAVDWLASHLNFDEPELVSRMWSLAKKLHSTPCAGTKGEFLSISAQPHQFQNLLAFCVGFKIGWCRKWTTEQQILRWLVPDQSSGDWGNGVRFFTKLITKSNMNGLEVNWRSPPTRLLYQQLSTVGKQQQRAKSCCGLERAWRKSAGWCTGVESQKKPNGSTCFILASAVQSHQKLYLRICSDS